MDEIRRALDVAVGNESHRVVAKKAKVSPAGLRYILGGGEPYRHTWNKLLKWYALEGARIVGDAMAGTAAAIELLVEVFPEEARPGLKAELTHALRQACSRRGLVPPAWTLVEADEANASAGPERNVPSALRPGTAYQERASC
jgi:hypothetical protein